MAREIGYRRAQAHGSRRKESDERDELMRIENEAGRMDEEMKVMRVRSGQRGQEGKRSLIKVAVALGGGWSKRGDWSSFRRLCVDPDCSTSPHATLSAFYVDFMRLKETSCFANRRSTSHFARYDGSFACSASRFYIFKASNHSHRQIGIPAFAHGAVQHETTPCLEEID